MEQTKLVFPQNIATQCGATNNVRMYVGYDYSCCTTENVIRLLSTTCKLMQKSINIADFLLNLCEIAVPIQFMSGINYLVKILRHV
jgi:hypothetical protein